MCLCVCYIPLVKQKHTDACFHCFVLYFRCVKIHDSFRPFKTAQEKTEELLELTMKAF